MSGSIGEAEDLASLHDGHFEGVRDSGGSKRILVYPGPWSWFGHCCLILLHPDPSINITRFSPLFSAPLPLCFQFFHRWHRHHHLTSPPSPPPTLSQRATQHLQLGTKLHQQGKALLRRLAPPCAHAWCVVCTADAWVGGAGAECRSRAWASAACDSGGGLRETS